VTAKQPPWLKEAAKHIGFHEGPNNLNPFGAHYRLNNEPWCALFVSFCCEKVGTPLPSMQSGMPDGYAGVYWGMVWAKAHGYWCPSWEAKPGDAIVYGWDGPNSPASEMHTGFIVSSGPKGSTGHTIEGNRGDQVERQTFTVGQSTVLGCIQITRILEDKRAKKVKRPKPVPQPRSSGHPHNTGPHPLSKTTAGQVEAVTSKLTDRKHALTHKPEGLLKRLRKAIDEALEKK
jgi:hypothetical protein